MKLEKITKSRSYDDSCASAHALDLLGDRWALLVVRELMLGPRRFADLRASLPGISANVLIQRLEDLKAAGVAMRHRLPPPASAQVYDLTEWGREAEPIILALGRWGARSPALDDALPFSAVSAMLSFRAMFDAERAAGLDLSVGFRFGAESYVATVHDAAIACGRGEAQKADVKLACTPFDAISAVYRLVPVDELESRGRLEIKGDRVAFKRFSAIFQLPTKAGAPGLAKED